MSEIQTCSTCKYGRTDDKSKQVICHRYPPHPTLINVPNPQAQFDNKQPQMVTVNQALPPALNPDWWCGEFAVKS